MLKHTGTIKIETEQLVLRQFNINDAKDMFNNWANDNDVTKFMTWPAHKDINVSRKVLNDWIGLYKNDDYYQWAIKLKESGKVIGSISVVNFSNTNEHCEVGYCIGKEFWGRGIMTETLKAVIKHLIDIVGFNRIEAIHHSRNMASGCVMKNAGMKYEGCKRKYHLNLEGEFVDCELYSILKDDVRCY